MGGVTILAPLGPLGCKTKGPQRNQISIVIFHISIVILHLAIVIFHLAIVISYITTADDDANNNN